MMWRVLYKMRSTREILNSFKADLVLTVAHDRSWLAASVFAKKAGLPLCTIFHDWYPDAGHSARVFIPLWDSAFRKLFRESKVALCVSEPMHAYLGDHHSSAVLYPIPNPVDLVSKVNPGSPQSRPVRLVYAGYCGGFYQGMLRRLLSSVAGQQAVTIDVCGIESERLHCLQNASVRIHPNMAALQLKELLGEMDGALVILPFDSAKRRHLELHFPSKLTDLAGRGLPILIWGPNYSSAVRWAEEHDAATTVTSEEPAGVLERATSLLSDSEIQPRCERARRIYERDFAPDIVHHTFLRSLQSATS